MQPMKESLFVVEFVSGRLAQILFAGWQHFSLVAQCLILATVLAVAIAVLVYRNKKLVSVANSVSAVGLTIPSFALIGLLVAPFGFGVVPAVIVVAFYATLPIQHMPWVRAWAASSSPVSPGWAEPIRSSRW
jgi:osmoprotectant transport system permease protein